MGNAESLPTPLAQPTCRLLALPAELRNAIYEYTYHVDLVSPVDLWTAAAPSKDLLLACRQTHQEARNIWDDACRQYWTKTHFTIRASAPATEGHHVVDAEVVAVAFTEQDLARIRHMCFLVSIEVLADERKTLAARARLRGLYGSDAILTLQRSDDKCEWSCVELDGIALADRAQERAILCVTDTRRNPAYLMFDADMEAKHWEARKRHCPVTVEELQRLTGFAVQVRPSGISPDVRTDGLTATILPLPCPLASVGLVARPPKDWHLQANDYYGP
ncbi:hypothetical protein LTR53_012879 [Teratosphaeriaceae sp. CCFEE 6253]|nr:hypothetical protein LTR53_012879 [Teratosphaeriaceae sp. CCFEE 6253]